MSFPRIERQVASLPDMFLLFQEGLILTGAILRHLRARHNVRIEDVKLTLFKIQSTLLISCDWSQCRYHN